jgi:hypothetical protein
MPVQRKIPLEPPDTLYYIVDSCFFSNKYLKKSEGDNPEDENRIENSIEWWEIIDWQVNEGKAIVFINDLCISETFKIIAKKYYQSKRFGKNRYQSIRKEISNDISIGVGMLISKNRFIKYHNLTVDRDIIVGTSRFLEIAHKNNLQSLSVIDLTIISSAKYLMDFFRIKKEQIFILTGDTKLIKCTKISSDCPNAIDPINARNKYSSYFYY